MINRDLLAYKLSQYGINGRFYMAIQTLCNDTTACVRINEYHTNWFSTTSGVKQGDPLSFTLFAICINDLAKEINPLAVRYCLEKK